MEDSLVAKGFPSLDISNVVPAFKTIRPKALKSQLPDVGKVLLGIGEDWMKGLWCSTREPEGQHLQHLQVVHL